MGMLSGESYLEYRKRVLDAISPSFCGAKWLNATIWLNSGTTASCHHPPPHPIDLKAIAKNPKALHNTDQKKEARRQMLAGERPSECEYCWKIEDLGKDKVSDRVFKSVNFEDHTLAEFKKLDYKSDVGLKSLEVAFDRTCQFSCMYCSPSFSTSWAQDIRSKGPYLNLPTDRRNHYTNTHEWAQSTEDNPYVRAFWEWWPELSRELNEFRITGGEPMMSQHFWKLLDKLAAEPNPNLRIAVNSNLGADTATMDRLLDRLDKIPNFEIYTSGEAYGQAGEYIRDGLRWNQWVSNMEKLMGSGKVSRMHIMMTINGLCLFSITEFLDQALLWKERFGFANPTLSLNILRFPTFQSPLVLPKELRETCRRELSNWLEKNSQSKLLIDFEKNSLIRLIDYLATVEVPTADAAKREDLEVDLKRFLTQYDARRKKNFQTALRPDAIQWLNRISAEDPR